MDCLSNDSTVLISVLLCLYKEFHIVHNCYQFEYSGVLRPGSLTKIAILVLNGNASLDYF